MLKSALSGREQVIPWGVPQIEDRALETAQREWQAYQDRLENSRASLEQTLVKLQQLERRFQSLDQWLADIELKVKMRSHRRSDCADKELQLQQLQVREERGDATFMLHLYHLSRVRKSNANQIN